MLSCSTHRIHRSTCLAVVWVWLFPSPWRPCFQQNYISRIPGWPLLSKCWDFCSSLILMCFRLRYSKSDSLSNQSSSTFCASTCLEPRKVEGRDAERWVKGTPRCSPFDGASIPRICVLWYWRHGLRKFSLLPIRNYVEELHEKKFRYHHSNILGCEAALQPFCIDLFRIHQNDLVQGR